MLEKLANNFMLKNPAKIASKIPIIHNATIGTSFLLFLPNIFGNNPSLLIVANICDVVKLLANITAKIPITLPKDTINAILGFPTIVNPYESASATSKFLYEVNPVRTAETAI